MIDEQFIDAARHAAERLPADVRAAVAAFLAAPPANGALRLAGLPVGEPPATPASPTIAVEKDLTSETTLLAVASWLGEAVGYLPEHGGDLVQNLVPTVDGADRQISTSSTVDLEFHTETAFHPYLPRYLLLLCLRGDPRAVTTLCSVAAVLPHLTAETIALLRQPRFRCGVDESFTDGRMVEAREPAPILWGDPEDPCLTFDADLMSGVDPAAHAALDELAWCRRGAPRRHRARRRRPVGGGQCPGGARPFRLRRAVRRHRPLAAASVRGGAIWLRAPPTGAAGSSPRPSDRRRPQDGGATLLSGSAPSPSAGRPDPRSRGGWRRGWRS